MKLTAIIAVFLLKRNPPGNILCVLHAVLHSADAGVAGNVYCLIALGNVIGKGPPQCQTL